MLDGVVSQVPSSIAKNFQLMLCQSFIFAYLRVVLFAISQDRQDNLY